MVAVIPALVPTKGRGASPYRKCKESGKPQSGYWRGRHWRYSPRSTWEEGIEGHIPMRERKTCMRWDAAWSMWYTCPHNGSTPNVRDCCCSCWILPKLSQPLDLGCHCLHCSSNRSSFFIIIAAEGINLIYCPFEESLFRKTGIGEIIYNLPDPYYRDTDRYPGEAGVTLLSGSPSLRLNHLVSRPQVNPLRILYLFLHQLFSEGFLFWKWYLCARAVP